ncbi:MAG: hemerythrin domain-containing protein [Burkholderiaceae bacterium]|nr:hemerythrin domain-containing protein [Burkholderiaceae bacterium]
MSQTPQHPLLEPTDAPLLNFSNCHEGIISHLKAFGELPALLEPAARARKIADETLNFFRDAVFEHHAEEERELFPAVLASAVKGEERDRVQVMVDQLTAEHRVIESAWAKLEPELKKVAKGHASELNVAGVEHLVRSYQTHAGFEETQFLPLAHTILGRNSNHMAALGMSLHIRQQPIPIGYI